MDDKKILERQLKLEERLDKLKSLEDEIKKKEKIITLFQTRNLKKTLEKVISLNGRNLLEINMVHQKIKLNPSEEQGMLKMRISIKN